MSVFKKSREEEPPVRVEIVEKDKKLSLMNFIKLAPFGYILLILYSCVKLNIHYGPYGVRILNYLSIDEIIVYPLNSMLLTVQATVFTYLLLRKSALDPFINGRHEELETRIKRFLLVIHGTFVVSFIYHLSTSRYDNMEALASLLFLMAISMFNVLTLLEFNRFLRFKYFRVSTFIIIVVILDLGASMFFFNTNSKYIEATNAKGDRLFEENQKYIGQTKNWVITIRKSDKRVMLTSIKDVHEFSLFYLKRLGSDAISNSSDNQPKVEPKPVTDSIQ